MKISPPTLFNGERAVNTVAELGAATPEVPRATASRVSTVGNAISWAAKRAVTGAVAATFASGVPLIEVGRSATMGTAIFATLGAAHLGIANRGFRPMAPMAKLAAGAVAVLAGAYAIHAVHGERTGVCSS